MRLTGIFDNIIYENKILSSVDNNFYDLIREYYNFSGEYDNDIKDINELYNIIGESEDFDPFGEFDTDAAEIEDSTESICVLGINVKGNSKLDWPYFSLPAGYTCPLATVCKNFAAKPGKKFSDGGSIKGGPEREFMCYAAREQGQYKNLGKKVFRNLELLKLAEKSGGVKGMADLIIDSIKFYNLENTKIFRIHEGGDFFSDDYLKAWIMVANTFTNTIFYTHTTSLNYWLNNRGSIPKNLRLIASMDKNNKDIILKNNLRYSTVVYSVEEAKKLRLRIDYDDMIAATTDNNFALLIHGGQPKGSDASKAVSNNRKSGVNDKIKQLHKANKVNRKKYT